MSKFYDGWEIQPVCKTCEYRKQFHKSGKMLPNSRWENTYCSYLEVTGECRGCEPEGDKCDRYERRVAS